MSELRDRVLAAATAMQAAGATGFPQTLRSFLAGFLSWPFEVRGGVLEDIEGAESDRFTAVVFTTPQDGLGTNETIPIDTAAVVIDASPCLGIQELRDAFGRIARAKRLKKGRVPDLATPIATSTMGIVLALETEVPLEILAEELRVLNDSVPGRQRLDMVVVAEKGAIQYMFQIPGTGTLLDILPGEQPKSGYPGVYTVMAVKPAGGFTMNRMLAFIIGYLKVFVPATSLPDWSLITRGTDNLAFVIVGYQYRINGDLVPTPRGMYNDRYLAPLPVEVLDAEGRHLAFVRRLPWQDGAVVLVEGSFPLELLLMCCGRNTGGSIRWENVGVSCVLDLSAEDFRRGLVAVQGRTRGIRLRPVKPNWTVKVGEEEGTSSPHVARLFIGILDLRQYALTDSQRRELFDKKYEILWSALSSARAAAGEISKVWDSHMEGVQNGTSVQVANGIIREQKDVDGPLRRSVETFLNASLRTTKNGLQEVAELLGTNLGFFFKKEGAFASGLKDLQGRDPDLASYLAGTRPWHEVLVHDRNKVEHESWKLPPTQYSLGADNSIAVAEPRLGDKPVTTYVKEMLDRICSFVEQSLVYLLEGHLPRAFMLTEIARRDRDPEFPKRFRLTTRVGGLPPWKIGTSSDRFSDN